LNVLVINCVCSNTGDAAILEAARTVMRSAWEDPQFLVQDDHPQRIANLYPALNVRGSYYWSLAYTEDSGWRSRLRRRWQFARFNLGRRLWRAGLCAAAKGLLSRGEIDYLEAYQWADVVVATGGTYLVEQYDLGQRLFDMETAVALGRPLVLYTQSLGPFKSSANRRRLRAILRKAALVLLRDERSVQHVRDLGVRHNRIRTTPDAAFALADDELATRSLTKAPLSRPHPRVAISVRPWNYFASGSPEEGMARYRESFTALVVHFVRRYEAEVTFLSTCQGAPGYHDDSQLAAEIAAALPDDIRRNVRVNSDFHSPGALIDLLRGFDCVVSTRMHLAILALGVGTPVWPVAYEFKTTELCRALGYAEPPLHVEELSPERLIASFESFVNSYNQQAEQISQAVARFRQDAWEVSKVLQNCVPQLKVESTESIASMEKSPDPNRVASVEASHHSRSA
jgi:colanic acid/amylovoran biosynthesis protein